MPDKRNSSKTRRLALAGVATALTEIILVFATLLPTSKIALYVLSSFFVAVIILELGIKSGWMFYAASSLLAAILIQNKLGLLPYVLFFGIYGIIKYYIEITNRLWLELILKYLYFNIFLLLAFTLLKQFFILNISDAIPLGLVWVALQLVFLVYDYIYTRVIQYYRSRLKNMIGI